MKEIKKKIKKVWNKDKVSIIVPIMSLLISLIATFTIGIIRSIILLIIINAIYFIPMYFKKKDKKDNLNKKQRKKKKSKRLKVFLIILLSLFILGVIGVIGFFTYIVINAPDFSEELLYVSDPSVILDKDGNEIARLGAEKRVKLDYDEIPEVLIDSIVATEDSRFFEHNGVDWARFIKASVLQLLGKSDAGGASTITMQVSKNTATSNEASGIQGIIRKFTDVYVSIFKIEKNYTKEQIFSFYVNSHYLGRNAYGVEQVALNYFGKSAKDLNVSEAAMIAGLFQAPGRYDPYKNPKATETRRKNVLKLMLRHGYISKDEYNIAKDLTVEKIILPQEQSNVNSGEVSKYQSFIDTVVDEIKDKTGQNPYSTPMIVYTTMNTDFQNYINDIMSGKSYDWENDVVQAGIAVLNVKDGSIVAIGGNRNVDAIDKYNFATDINNQIGSTAKPLYDYGPAIEYNNWSPYNIVVDEPITYSDGHQIGNWNGTYEGFETARKALSGSRNIPALKTFQQNDKAKVIEFVTNLGLTPEIYSCKKGYTRDGKKCINNKNPDQIIDAQKDTTLHEAHAIGGYNGESPLTMAAAYSAFSNGGKYTEPYSFTKIVYQKDNKEYVNKINSKTAMSPETAYLITDMLTTTAPNAFYGYYNINGIKYAAKTGTTNFDEKTIQAHNIPANKVNDLWAIGFNTEYAIGVWYGYQNLNSGYYNNLNALQQARLFQAVGKKIFTNGDAWVRPDGISEVAIEYGCAEACLPSSYTPSDLIQTELFVKGTEPSTISPRFEKLTAVSNLKATFTDNKIIITWTAVPTPEVNTEKYLRETYSKVFQNTGFLDSYINERFSFNNSRIGNIGYYVYEKTSDGNLKQIDYVGTNKIEITPDEVGTHTYVVKTSYSIFKSNMSDGKEVKITVNNISKPDPIIVEKEEKNKNKN